MCLYNRNHQHQWGRSVRRIAGFIAFMVALLLLSSASAQSNQPNTAPPDTVVPSTEPSHPSEPSVRSTPVPAAPAAQRGREATLGVATITDATRHTVPGGETTLLLAAAGAMTAASASGTPKRSSHSASPQDGRSTSRLAGVAVRRDVTLNEIEQGYVLRQGDGGPGVIAIQYFLQQSNLLQKIDGDYGPQTVAAVQTYQRRRQLPPTGQIDAATRAAIYGEAIRVTPNRLGRVLAKAPGLGFGGADLLAPKTVAGGRSTETLGYKAVHPQAINHPFRQGRAEVRTERIKDAVDTVVDATDATSQLPSRQSPALPPGRPGGPLTRHRSGGVARRPRGGPPQRVGGNGERGALTKRSFEYQHGDARAVEVIPEGTLTEAERAGRVPRKTTQVPAPTAPTDKKQPPTAPRALPPGQSAATPGTPIALNREEYLEVGEPRLGTLEARILYHPQTKKTYLFKPYDPDPEVPTHYGITVESYGKRSIASKKIIDRLGGTTPAIQLVQYGDQHGSLQEWVPDAPAILEMRSMDFKRYNRLTRSPSYERLLHDVYAIDYVLGNLDRNQGNILIVTDGDDNSQVQKLVLIDNDVTFPATTTPAIMEIPTIFLPDRYSRATYERLKQLWQDRPAVTNELQPYLTEAEIEAMWQRLDIVISDIERKVETRGEAQTFFD